MNKTLLAMILVAIALVVIAFFQGGFALVADGLMAGGKTLLEVFPLILIAFTVAGSVSSLISKDMVTKWLGEGAGWKGPLLGTLMGALVPGGPFFFYPLMATLIVSGANIGTMISFVAAKTLWYVGRIPIEIAFVGVKVTLVRILLTFAIPVLAGAAVNAFLPGYSEKIRVEVTQLQKKSKKGQNRGVQN